jgi:hypothetical protein
MTMDASPLLTAIVAHTAMAVLGAILAVGYLASRIIEVTIMMVGIAATLLLIPLSQEFLKAGAPHGSWFQTMGDVRMLGLGGLLFTWMLFRYRLVPRSIAVVGLIGYALVFLFSIAAWFGLVDPSPGASGLGGVLVLPVAAFEIILLPFWLFFKGFKMPEAPLASSLR